MNKRAILIPAFLVAALAAFALWRAARGTGDPNQIRLSGNIELTEVDLSFKVPGRVIELTLDEGDAVKKEQIVARLDSTEVERMRDRELAGVASAQSMLTQLRTSIDYQRTSLTDDAALRRAEVQQAEARLREMETGSRPEEIEQARAALEEAAVQARQSKADWDRAQILYRNDDISRQQFDQFRSRNDASAAVVQRSKEAYSLVKQGPRKEQIEQARAQLERARAALRLSEAGRIDLKRREQEVAARTAEIQRAEAQAGVYESQLSDRTLSSPVDGVVLTKSAERGEVLAAGSVLLTLGDVDRPWVRGYIGEKDLGRIKLGMPAGVTTDSFPGKTYKGKVTFISSEAEFTPKQIQTQEERVKLVYRVKIEVENPNRELKSNMPVDAVIRVQ
jgi:HlyD family secretion protein